MAMTYIFSWTNTEVQRTCPANVPGGHRSGRMIGAPVGGCIMDLKLPGACGAAFPHNPTQSPPDRALARTTKQKEHGIAKKEIDFRLVTCPPLLPGTERERGGGRTPCLEETILPAS
eukprot:gene14510-biopygen14188